jgi:hypothetical protein
MVGAHAFGRVREISVRAPRTRPRVRKKPGIPENALSNKNPDFHETMDGNLVCSGRWNPPPFFRFLPGI